MSAKSRITTIMKGDTIEWEIQFLSRARIQQVWATFVKDAHTARPRNLVLGGQASSPEQTSEGRIARATLRHSKEYSDKIEPGDYHFRMLEGMTAGGDRHNFEAPAGEMIIRVDPEPERDEPRLMENRFRIV